MITHAAQTLHDMPRSTPDGMPVARCGWQNDGHGVAVAWERRFIDCPMCLLMLDGVNYVPGLGNDLHNVSTPPGMELPVRTPRRPDYVPEGHIYTPPEFRPARRHNVLTVLALWVMVLAVILTFVALWVRWDDNVGSSGPPAIVVTPTTYGPPPA